MREMKDSGFKWLGKIPKSWELKRIKNFILENVNKKRGVKETDVLSLGIKGVSIKQDLSFGMNPTNYNDHNLVARGQYVICLRDLDGPLLCGISPYNGCLSALYYVLVLDEKNINKVFFNYVMKTMDNTRVIDAYSYGMRHSYNLLQFGNLRIPTPSLLEQQKIADYLDRKCGEIDSVMADLQEQIDKLEQYKRSVISEAVTKGMNQKAPMKDSGISWVGMIPANWGVKRGKYIFSYIQKPTREDDGVITCFRDGEVTLRSNRREDGFTMSDKEIGYQGIDVGDLIIHGMDGFAGAIGISDSRGKASPVLNVLETNQSKRYFMYLLRTMAYKGVFEALSTGIRVRTCDTNWGKIKNIFYIVPPVEEQMCIVNYIDDKCTEIESIIADKKQQLEVVENYKKSLIYEYVTGKKEVVDE